MKTQPNNLSHRGHILVDPMDGAAQNFCGVPDNGVARARRESIPRRRFLARLAVLGPVAWAGMAAAPHRMPAGTIPGTDWPFQTSTVKLDMVTRDDFARCLGSRFRLHVDSGKPVEVELIAATALASRPPIEGLAKRGPFSIVFRAPRDFLVPQKIYQLQHDKLGTLDIFLVPIGPDAHGMRYEAVFN